MMRRRSRAVTSTGWAAGALLVALTVWPTAPALASTRTTQTTQATQATARPNAPLGVTLPYSTGGLGFAGRVPQRSGWLLQRTGNPYLQNGTFTSVSCSSASACTAVGDYIDKTGLLATLAARWNGTAWTIEDTSNPPHKILSTLQAVSCPSATWCEAVGEDDEGFVAEAWNGSSWTLQKIPTPAHNAGLSLNGLSCASPDSCFAVGAWTTFSGIGLTLVERWDGTSWKIQHSANRQGVFGNVLTSVSCSATTACSAVGYTQSGSFLDAPFAESWNGRSWTLESAARVSGSTQASLSGVSCTDRDDCTAVGSSQNESGVTQTLAEAWNGQAWTVMPTPDRTNAVASSLYQVSCSSADACTAAGASLNSSQVTTALAERWNGSAWSLQKGSRVAATRYSPFAGVACTADSSCVAVGLYQSSGGTNQTLAEVWNGETWTQQSSPNRGGSYNRQLDGVSCTTSASCTAVGSASVATLAETRVGASWKAERTANPKGALLSSLTSDSCASETLCAAVGSEQVIVNGYFVQSALAEVRHDTAWRLTPVAEPVGNQGSALSSVSCTAANSCTAVGSYLNSTGAQVTLAEVWNGHAWKVRTTPNPQDAIASGLFGVSCVSSTMCIAVGSYIGSSDVPETLAEVWNGSSWTIQNTVNPPNVIAPELGSVSCSSSTFCAAIGSYSSKTGTKAASFSEVWNGAAWQIKHTPNPDRSVRDVLFSVSCTAATACTAVGTYINSDGVQVTLAQGWNGTSWTTQRTQAPKGAVASALQAVSCTGTRTCSAVGSYIDSVGLTEVLAEQEG